MPFAWMVANSFKDIRGIYKYPPEFIPEVWHFENYTEAWTMTHFDAGFLNSAIVAAAVVLGQLFTASLGRLFFRSAPLPRARQDLPALYFADDGALHRLADSSICADALLQLDQYLASGDRALPLHPLGHLHDAAIHGDYSA